MTSLNTLSKLLILLGLSFLHTAVSASACLPPGDKGTSSFDWHFKNIDIAFTGNLVDVKSSREIDPETGWTLWRINFLFEVNELFKGEVRDKKEGIKVYVEYGCENCNVIKQHNYFMETIGTSYVVYAGMAQGEYEIDSCLSFKPLKEASSELTILRERTTN